jgi:hypothetical protein
MKAYFLRPALLCSLPRLVRRSFHSLLTGQYDSSKLMRMNTSQNDKIATDNSQGESGDVDMITILGFGSLLSERSCRVTFPNLHNFRLGRVPDYRRVFAHPASIFFQRGIADLASLQMSSLSVEYDEGNSGFIVSVFEVPNDGMMEGGIPSQAFLEREEEFNIVRVPYEVLTNKTALLSEPTSSTRQSSSRLGIICTRSTDQAYLDRWGKDRFDTYYRKYGVETIWGYGRDSGLRPCAVYLRHCYLAATSMGQECLDSFLDQTFLVDRVTTVRDYLEKHPEVLETTPPPELVDRYSG